MLKGVDVWENNSVNWAKAKAAGLDFAILKCGYGSDSASQDDSQFLHNASECERLHIPYGVYLYSYALDVTAAKSELKHILRLLKGHHPQYPVFIDMEDADGYKARNGGVPSAQTNTNIVRTVCDGLSQRGYKAGYYCNRDWYYNHLYPAQLKKYEFWYARPDVSKPDLSCNLWQTKFGENGGRFVGVSGGVDLDVGYKDYAEADAPKLAPNGAGFKCDTTTLVTVPAGKDYTAKITCAAGRPAVIAGSGGIVDISYTGCKSNDYFYKFTAKGKVGQATGIYINGHKPSTFIVRVGTSVECDTTTNFSKKIGECYKIGLTCPHKPTVTVGSGNIAAMCGVYSVGNNKWLCPIVAVRPGTTGIYTEVPGEGSPVKRFEFKVV